MTVLVCGLLMGALGCAARVPARPNVLLVTLDTTRADRLGCYGWRRAETPALDGLARDGVRFDAAYASSPMTLPSHATLFTGLEPPEHGLRLNGQSRLPDGVPTLASRLHEQGYRTGGFVAAFVLDRRFGLDRGFEVYDDALGDALPQVVPERLALHRRGDAVVDAALGWLDEAARGPAPFLAWVHLYDPHAPDHPHGDAGASYDGEVAFMDRQVARLLAFLERRGLARRTLVVAVADHGEGLGDHGDAEHGFLLDEEVLRVPLLVRWPGVVARGHAVGALVTTRDLAPTILDLTGSPPLAASGGRSLRAALAGGTIASGVSYAETDLPLAAYGWSPQRSLTTEDWKYVRTPRPELYARPSDRAEHHDVAAADPARVAALDGALADVEASFRPLIAPEARLDARARARLEALGYAASSAPAARTEGLRDVKDMLEVKRLGTDVAVGLATGRLDAPVAIVLLRTLVERSPESAPFRVRLGTLLLVHGDVPGAIAELEEAVRLHPDLADARINLGQATLRAGRPADAAAQFRAALALEPDRAGHARPGARSPPSAGATTAARRPSPSHRRPCAWRRSSPRREGGAGGDLSPRPSPARAPGRGARRSVPARRRSPGQPAASRGPTAPRSRAARRRRRSARRGRGVRARARRGCARRRPHGS
ncbi:MAG: sulfatase-like hydrolase/transferase [bacterium]|nr:sulfatase-like hydrolase/transferase [bacterium]